jgi:hypothetical protein
MQPKKKPCKGNRAETKGLGCDKPTFHRIYGLGKMCGCYSDWLLNTEAGKLKMQKAIIKAKEPRLRLQEAQREDKLQKSLPIALKATQIVFNKYIRLRDKGKNCISSDVPYRSDFDAGHLYSVKQFSGLRFNESNVHGQSIGDNRFNEGNFAHYLINVKNRIGQKAFNNLQKEAEFYKVNPKKWTLDELSEIRKEYINKIKLLNT